MRLTDVEGCAEDAEKLLGLVEGHSVPCALEHDALGIGNMCGEVFAGCPESLWSLFSDDDRDGKREPGEAFIVDQG